MSAVTLDSLAVGSAVTLNISGAATEFIITHQGLPSDDYDDSCNGTWLLMKNVFEKRAWDSTDNDYANSDIDTYLNNTFVNLFDSDIKAKIKQAKIPYTNGDGNGSVAGGSGGLERKLFLLSYQEVYGTKYSYSNVNSEGAVLQYFDSYTVDRIGKYNSTKTGWYLRSPVTNQTGRVLYVRPNDGSPTDANITDSLGVRPALILPSTIWADESNNIITTPPYNTYAGVAGAVRSVTDYAGVAGAVRSVTTYKGVGGAVRS